MNVKLVMCLFITTKLILQYVIIDKMTFDSRAVFVVQPVVQEHSNMKSEMTYVVYVKQRTGETVKLFETNDKETADRFFDRTTVLGATYNFVALLNVRSGVELRSCNLQND